ncbi:MAG: hypothetical protein MJ246_01585 [Clostridia bacterium]|nr:hypothetical protein [Clostridia bacterium]
MDDFKGVVKIDFKEQREKSGFNKEDINSVFKTLNYGFDVDAVENGTVKMSEEQVNTYMGICGTDPLLKKDYYAKYTTNYKY